MSQVVVTEDSYNGARQATLQQERRINCEAEFDRFHLSDVTKMYGVLRAVFTPILLPVIIVASYGGSDLGGRCRRLSHAWYR